MGVINETIIRPDENTSNELYEQELINTNKQDQIFGVKSKHKFTYNSTDESEDLISHFDFHIPELEIEVPSKWKLFKDLLKRKHISSIEWVAKTPEGKSRILREAGFIPSSFGVNCDLDCIIYDSKISWSEWDLLDKSQKEMILIREGFNPKDFL